VIFGPSGVRPAGASSTERLGLQQDEKATRRLFFLLAAGILAGYALTFSGSHFGRIGDGEEMIETAVSLREFHDLKIFNPDFEKAASPDPSRYSKYGLGFPLLLQLPLFVANQLQSWLGWKEADYVLAATNLLLTVFTSLLVAGTARRLGHGHAGISLAALSFSFGSFAWPYISYDFSEPFQGFCLVLAAWALLGARPESPKSWGWLLVSGLSLGVGVLTKASLVLAIPAYSLFLWLRSRRSLSQALRMQIWLWTPILCWGVVIAGLNVRRFGTILEFGYRREAALFTTPLATGLYGLLLSPSKGLLFYAPITLLLPLGLAYLFRHRRDDALFLSVLSLSVVLPAAKWWSWEGGASWGPRLLYPVLPFLVLASVAPVMFRKSARSWSVLLLVGGAAINLLGVLFFFSSWGVVINSAGEFVPLDVRGRREGDFQVRGGQCYVAPFVAMNYLPSLSPIRGHAWVLSWRYREDPFPMSGISERPPVDDAPFGPVRISFLKLKGMCVGDPALHRDLLSAQFLVSRLVHAESDAGRPLPVRGRAMLSCGLRFLGEKEFAKAYDALHRARESGCDRTKLLASLGIACMRSGRFAEGRENLEAYLERVPEAHGARLFYAHSLETNGLSEAALAQYVRLRELQPDGPHRAEIDERIAALSRASSPSSSSTGAGLLSGSRRRRGRG
jgi:hypothetical protein